MKIKQLLLAGVVSIALFSCSDKDDVSVSQDEIKSISVSLGGIKTRAFLQQISSHRILRM